MVWRVGLGELADGGDVLGVLGGSWGTDGDKLTFAGGYHGGAEGRSADGRNGQPFTYFSGKVVWNFGVARNGFNDAVGRIDPKRVLRSFPLQIAAVPSQMPEQVTPFHSINRHRVLDRVREPLLTLFQHLMTSASCIMLCQNVLF